MMGSILQMRKGQLECNAASQWSYYAYIGSDNSGMILCVFMTPHPSSTAVVKLAFPSECACVCFASQPRGGKRQTQKEDGSLNAEKKTHE